MKLNLNMPPLYTKAYHLHLDLMRACQSFPKHFRPSLGQRMEQAALDLTVLIRIALLTKGQKGFAKALALVDALKVYLQTAYDLRLLSPGRFSSLSEELIEIGRILSSLTGKSYESSKPYRENRRAGKSDQGPAPLSQG